MTEREISFFWFFWSMPRYEFTNVNRDFTAEKLVLTDISNIKNI